MKSPTKSDDSALLSPLLAGLAGFLPFVVYAFSAGGYSFWLDSAEFTAAAVDLDIAHPPGHPLAALWGRTFALLPIGSLSYRVALAQGLCGAVASAALYVAFARTLRALEVAPRACALLALGGCWLLSFSYGFWFQAVRAEVYALQTMLICLALEQLVALAVDAARDVRPLYLASFYLGLGMANHHFMSVLALPAMAHGLWYALRAYGARALFATLGCGLMGVSAYVYLPLRAASEPAMDLGHPVTPASLWWVISAQVYARKIGDQATQPMGERFADLLVILAEQFSLVTLLLALAGLYLLARKRTLWPLACVWSVTALITLCGRAWLNPVRNNPDVLGYMLPGFAAYLVLALAALVLMTSALPTRARRGGELLLGVLTLCLALLQADASYARATLADFHATDDFDELRLRTVPQRALLVLTQPETTFRHWEARAVARARPDLRMLPLPFVNYAGSGDLLLRRQPELRDVIQRFQRSPDGALDISSLRALAHTRPVLVEADLRSCWPLFPGLLPEGLLYRVVEREPTRHELREAASAREKSLRALYAALGEQLSGVETRRQVLWLHFMDALYFASHGETELALAFVQRGLALQPKERELLRLQQVLKSTPERFALREFVPPG